MEEHQCEALEQIRPFGGKIPIRNFPLKSGMHVKGWQFDRDEFFPASVEANRPSAAVRETKGESALDTSELAGWPKSQV
jgi:hypothetical protein